MSTIQATKAVVNEMKQNGYGSIVITSSLASFCGIYGLSVYSATKFALRGFAEALSMEVNTYWASEDNLNNILFSLLCHLNLLFICKHVDKELWSKSDVGLASRYRYSRVC